jgi:hypothetical protein
LRGGIFDVDAKLIEISNEEEELAPDFGTIQRKRHCQES